MEIKADVCGNWGVKVCMRIEDKTSVIVLRVEEAKNLMDQIKSSIEFITKIRILRNETG